MKMKKMVTWGSREYLKKSLCINSLHINEENIRRVNECEREREIENKDGGFSMKKN